MQNRDNDTTDVECKDCGWRGKALECRHGYVNNPLGIPELDVEPMDYCPKCDSDQVYPLEVA